MYEKAASPLCIQQYSIMNYFDYINAYLDNELTSEERAQFEAELANNKDLANEVELHKTLQAGVMAAGLREEMQKIAARKTSQGTPVQGRRIQLRRTISVAIAASVAVLLGIFLWNNQGSSDQTDLFASVYYQDPGTAVAMGNSEEQNFDEAMTLYKEQRYDDALFAFDELCNISNNVKACYYKAQSALNAHKLDLAKKQLLDIIDNGSVREYTEKSEWYLAYILYQQGDEAYRPMIKEIAGEEAHRFNIEAQEVLRVMKND